jgi:acetyl esterase/lipase
MKKVLFLLSFLMAAFGAMAADYKFERDVQYRSDDDYAKKMCKVDIAIPKGAKDAPVIIWFHGGGLTGGGKHIPYEIMRDGVVCVGVGYRFSPHVSVDQIVDDAACAIAWVFENIEKFGGSADKIFLSGHSAGGYLVSMVGLQKSYLEKYGIDANRVKGIIPFSGQMITHFEERRVRGMSDKLPLIDKMAPLYHVRGDAAPILLLTGDREREMLGRYEENAYMYRMLRLVGHKDVTLYEFDGYGHDMCVPGYPMLMQFVKEHK